MGIKLVDNHRRIDRVYLTALVSRNDTGWYPCGSHHDDKSVGIVFAKPSSGLKQKFIHCMLAQCRGLQGVDIFFDIKFFQNRVDVVPVTHMPAPKFLCILSGERVCIIGEF